MVPWTVRNILPSLLSIGILTSVPAWANEGESIPLGTRRFLESEILNESREVLIRLPDGYDADEDRYPVLYVLDGEWHFLQVVSAVQMLAECGYVRNHTIPQLLIVGIVNVDRNRDYTPTRAVEQHGMSFPTSGEAAHFLRFLEEELISFIDESYRTNSYRMLSGWSFGGLLTTHALLAHPEMFDGYLAISPSLWWDEELLLKRAADVASSRTKRKRSLVLTIGSDEEGGLCYNAVKKLVDQFDRDPIDGLEFTPLEIPGVNHNDTPLKAYYEGLRTLFVDWTITDEIAEQGLEAVEAHYEKISAKYKDRIEVPGHLYYALSRHYLTEGDAEEAFRVAQVRIERQVDLSLAFFDMARLCEQAGNEEKARDSYRQALKAEMAGPDLDSVFVNYVTGILDRLEGNSR